jgi:hypothetical protein
MHRRLPDKVALRLLRHHNGASVLLMIERYFSLVLGLHKHLMLGTQVIRHGCITGIEGAHLLRTTSTKRRRHIVKLLIARIVRLSNKVVALRYQLLRLHNLVE